MLLKQTLAVTIAASILITPVAVCSQAAFGTATEAKAMLEKAVAAVKADKAKAIATFNAGEGGFKDRDLYPFCFNIADGITVVGPMPVRGLDVRTIKDAAGTMFGKAIFDAAKDGAVTEVNYVFARPGADTTPVAKISFVTKAGDLGCGVGYYK